jgi:hypothetical protein
LVVAGKPSRAPDTLSSLDSKKLRITHDKHELRR